MRVFLTTLGCKLNESEIETWARQFGAAGCQIVNDARAADLIVVNTCTVTSQAARKSRTTSRHLARMNPSAKIVLTGCYATISPNYAANMPNVVRVVPNRDKDTLVRLAGDLWNDTRFQMLEGGCRLPEAVSGELASERRESDTLSGYVLPHLRTRAFVKVEDGCNMSCAFCIIPLARGNERSRPAGDIIRELEQLVLEGYKEVILTGVQISDYEYDGDKKHGLNRLVQRILKDVPLPRLRLTSIAPWDLDDELLQFFDDPRLCRHLHLSLQSGSDTVLRRMRRPYTTSQYRRAVERAREKVPSIAITTDVIVGFPGESDVEFDQSREFVESIGFARIHVFPYSRREDTIAAALPLQVGDKIKNDRAVTMQEIADASAQKFAAQFLGKTLSVLWEAQTENGRGEGYWSGYTDNYIRVFAPTDENLQNEIAETLLTELAPDGVFGQVIRSRTIELSPYRTVA